MADIEINTESLASTVQKLEAQTELLENALKNMYQGIEELNQTWEGPNHDEFEADFSGKHADMKELNKMLKSYVRALKKAEKTYESCEDDVYSVVRAQ